MSHTSFPKAFRASVINSSLHLQDQISHLYILRRNLGITVLLSFDPAILTTWNSTNKGRLVKLVVVTAQIEHRLVSITLLNCPGTPGTTLCSLPYLMAVHSGDLSVLKIMVFGFMVLVGFMAL